MPLDAGPDGAPAEGREGVNQVQVQSHQRSSVARPHMRLQVGPEVHQGLRAPGDGNTELPAAEEEALELPAVVVDEPLGHHPAQELAHPNRPGLDSLLLLDWLGKVLAGLSGGGGWWNDV